MVRLWLTRALWNCRPLSARRVLAGLAATGALVVAWWFVAGLALTRLS
jgi:hypothetical protein